MVDRLIVIYRPSATLFSKYRHQPLKNPLRSTTSRDYSRHWVKWALHALPTSTTAALVPKEINPNTEPSRAKHTPTCPPLNLSTLTVPHPRHMAPRLGHIHTHRTSTHPSFSLTISRLIICYAWVYKQAIIVTAQWTHVDYLHICGPVCICWFSCNVLC